jgi:S-DNA-T family DNA segregation ATPase FtsK/SpoIIIE
LKTHRNGSTSSEIDVTETVLTRDEASRLAAVLRSRGRNNSLFDINRAADFLEQAHFPKAILTPAPTNQSEDRWWDVKTERLPNDVDAAYIVVKDAVIAAGKPSASYLQRRFGIGYNRAASFIDRMEREKLISAWSDAEKGRTVLVPAPVAPDA